MSWLKELPANTDPMAVTRPVSHLLMSALKEPALANIFLMHVTCLVVQLETSSLKSFLFSNKCEKSSARDTSHSDVCPNVDLPVAIHSSIAASSSLLLEMIGRVDMDVDEGKGDGSADNFVEGDNVLAVSDAEGDVEGVLDEGEGGCSDDNFVEGDNVVVDSDDGDDVMFVAVAFDIPTWLTFDDADTRELFPFVPAEHVQSHKMVGQDILSQSILRGDSRHERPHASLGASPKSPLSCVKSAVNCLNKPRSSGTVPVKEFPHSWRFSNWGSTVASDRAGMVPRS